MLLLTTLFQVRFGLAPLNRISRGLAAIRSGQAEKLEGAFPVEIEPLARETNALIDANREIVERARTHVGNLAHALKTPLSVMVNEAATRGPTIRSPPRCKEQTDIMRDQVTRHLERARLAARVAVVGTITEVVPVVQALARTMEKTHHDKDLAIDLDLPGEARFRGERQDLEEMVGNLVDNACKWASSRVSIEVLLEQPEPGAAGRAHRGRRRRAGADAGAARAGGAARPAARRDQAGLGAGPLDRGGACRRSTAARSISAPRRSAACGRSWCCRRGEGAYFFCPRSFALSQPSLPAFVFPAFFHNSLLASRAPSVSACELRPDDARVDLLDAREGRKAAVGAGDHPLLPHQLREPPDPLGHQLRDARPARSNG